MLLIDLGNSRLKWQLKGNNPVAGAVSIGQDWETLFEAQWVTITPPARVIAVSVQSPEVEGILQRWVEQHWHVPVEFLRSSACCCGVINAYDAPETLGPDRWAALIGARALRKSATLVVDCGTAVTIDLLSGGGVHRGGWIVPGIKLMGAALSAGTARVGGLDTCPQSDRHFGSSTADAVFRGAISAIAGAITQGLAQARHEVGPEVVCLLTGGDATVVAPLIDETCLVTPDLIFSGLACYAEQCTVVEQ